MINRLQLLDEDRLSVGNVAEGNGTLLEIALGHLGIDQPIHEFSDSLLRVVRQ